jgi:hypothetical protein
MMDDEIKKVFMKLNLNLNKAKSLNSNNNKWFFEFFFVSFVGYFMSLKLLN